MAFDIQQVVSTVALGLIGVLHLAEGPGHRALVPDSRQARRCQARVAGLLAGRVQILGTQ